MGVKYFKTKIKDLGKERSLRFDINFLDFNIKRKNEIEYYKFLQLFNIVEKDTKIIIDDENFMYAEIGDVEKSGDVNFIELNSNNRDELNENYFKKIEKGDIIQPNHQSILISAIRPNLKKFVFIDKELEHKYFTKAFIEIKSNYINPKIMYYALRTIFFENIISIARQGKGYPTLKSSDLNYMIFDKSKIDKLKAKQSDILKAIDPIEIKIKKLKMLIKPIPDVINVVFNREFGFDYKKLRKLQQEKINVIDFSLFSNNRDLRNSCKFHSKTSQFAYNELKSKTCNKIKDYINEPIVLGASVSPKDYDENGDYRYLSMASIKNWEYEEENAPLISNHYSKENNKKIEKNDILIARSGEGTIGKVALITEDVNAVFCDFTMRIKLKNYNHLFAYYYFRSEFFQQLIYAHKKGLGNNTNIFPSQIQEFPMLDISADRQKEIVDEIKQEIDEQNKIKLEIEKLRNRIDTIIETAITE